MGISGNYRSPQIDRIRLNDDGSFKQVVGTMKGVEQLKLFDPYGFVSAVTMSHQAGIDVVDSAGDPFVRTVPGSWIRITGVDFRYGTDVMSISAMSKDGGTVYVLLDSMNGPVAAKIDIARNSQSMSEFVAPFKTEGTHDLYFVFTGEIDLNGWEAYSETGHVYPTDHTASSKAP